jgi:hypothetical protein
MQGYNSQWAKEWRILCQKRLADMIFLNYEGLMYRRQTNDKHQLVVSKASAHDV